MPPLRLAFLGLGTMGLPMAGRLLDAGFPLTVWNRTKAAAAPLVARGARLAATPRAAAADADAALVMLTGPEAVDAVVHGDDGLLAGLRPGALLVDHSTCDPETERALYRSASERAVRFVDAPVYGSRRPAEEGTLVVLAGGDAADIETLRPIFAAVARRVVHAGPPGAGAALKLAVNASGAHVLAGIATGLALAEAAGVDPSVFLDALAAGAFTSPLLALKGPLMAERRYTGAAFRLDLLRKDVSLARDLAAATGVATATLDALLATTDAAIARGHGASDLAAYVEAVRVTARSES